MALRAAILAVVVVATAQANPIKLFQRAGQTIQRQVDSFDVSETAQIAKEGLNTLLREVNSPRRLQTSSCGYTAAFLAAQGKECGSAIATPLLSNKATFSAYCTETCAAKLMEIQSTLLASSECSAEADRAQIRMYGSTCTQGMYSGAMTFCFGQDAYMSFAKEINLLATFNASYDVAPFCVANSCTSRLLGGILAAADEKTKLIWDLIGKYMCLTPPGATETCWKDTANLFSGKGDNPMNTLVTNPSKFCTEFCGRALISDMMDYHTAVAATPADKAQKQAAATTMQSMVSFSCMQKEDKAYCISVAMNTIAFPSTLNYDGNLVTKPICPQPTETNDDSDDTGITCDAEEGMCAPWCKVPTGGYNCKAKTGQCEDFKACNKTSGRFAKHACSCVAQIGQLMSYGGCCVAAVVNFNCKSMLGGAKYDSKTVDIEMCKVDEAASKAKGYDMLNGLVNAEKCGYVLDPRCSHGKDVNTLSFDLTYKNVDTTKAYGAPSGAVASIRSLTSSTLSAAPDDITVDLYPATSGGRRLSTSSTLKMKVTIAESGATNLAMVADIKKSSVESGKMERTYEKASGLSAESGKVLSLSDVSADKSATKSGVKGTTPAQVKATVADVEAGVTPTGTAAGTTTSSAAAGCLSNVVLVLFAIWPRA